MCGRYWIDPEDNAELAQIIAEMQRCEGVKTGGEIFPGDRVPVLCRSRAGNVRPFGMEWGYRISGGKRLINARSETAAEKPMFRESMVNRRCVLPMNAYFEWEKTAGGRQKYRIAPEGEGLCYLAGIYRFEGTDPVCTVLTTAAAPDIAFIHHRMPVLLRAGETQAWLSGETINFARQVRLAFAQE